MGRRIMFRRKRLSKPFRDMDCVERMEYCMALADDMDFLTGEEKAEAARVMYRSIKRVEGMV